MKATTICALFLFGIAGIACPQEAQKNAAPEPKAAADDKTILALIAQLGDEAFEKRDAAHKRLLAVGVPALGLLTKTVRQSADLETRERALQIMQEIQELGLHLASVEFYHDFRKKGFPKEHFRLVGPNAEERVKSEAEGLRIAVPGAQEKPAPVGIVPRFTIRGDFEITLGYELLRAEQPKMGFGVGLNFYVQTTASSRESIAMSRLIRPDGRNVYGSARMTLVEPKEREPVAALADKPAAGKSGQLRMTRVGPKVALSAAEGAGKDFRLLYRVDLGTEDVTPVRMVAVSGAAANVVEVRLTDFRVRCADKDALK